MNNRGGCHLQGGYTAPHAYCAGDAEWPADRIEGTPLIAKDKPLFLRFLGTDSHEREEFLIGRIQKSIMDLGKDKFFPVNPDISEIKDSPKCEINDPSAREDFRIRLNYNYRQSIGEATLEQAAHNAASAERIAKFRSEVFINEKLLNGPSVAMFEPK
jgi:hypothetical protein